MFSGSYDPADGTFLLKPVRLAPTPVAEKERLIQSGEKHYSEMIGPERPPSPRYLEVFYQALEQNRDRFYQDLLTLARRIAADRPGAVTLVSLARAGTPVAALVGRMLRHILERPAVHYSVSIIRDRGIDANALRFIVERHPPKSVVFVDGWTGKGVIARELRQAVLDFNARYETSLDPGLYVVADLCGAAAFAATTEDYLIPSSVLGCTISGLVSRSILNDAVVGPEDFHGCIFYEELAAHDLSRWFLDYVLANGGRQPPGADDAETDGPYQGADAPRSPAQRSAAFLAETARRFAVRDLNHIKPGIGEATRVLLRRVPDRLLVQDLDRPDVAHLLHLAREKSVPVIVEPALAYRAAALIREVDG